MSVHPHVRGVYAQRPYSARQQCGPSPRAWGLRWARPRPCSWSPVHPHVRGVYEGGTDEESDAAGPSPRSWGLRSLYVWQDGGAAVHPHVRGVYRAYKGLGGNGHGPSPRAWGLLVQAPGRAEADRSIPTCAGFTSAATSPSAVLAVHPHVRGVYARCTRATLPLVGPSPRAWGLPGRVRRWVQSMRSIPTCVGFTTERLLPRLTWDGPSPRAWGLRISGLAGDGARAVHPHVRGVYISRYSRSHKTRRSIPTCVGFTRNE